MYYPDNYQKKLLLDRWIKKPKSMNDVARNAHTLTNCISNTNKIHYLDIVNSGIRKAVFLLINKLEPLLWFNDEVQDGYKNFDAYSDEIKKLFKNMYSIDLDDEYDRSILY